MTVLVSSQPLTENSGISDKEICKVKENSPYLHHFKKISWYLTLWRPENAKRGTLLNSESPDEMPHDATFHQGLHCLLRRNPSSEKEKLSICFASIACSPSIYAMDHSDFIVCMFV